MLKWLENSLLAVSNNIGIDIFYSAYIIIYPAQIIVTAFGTNRPCLILFLGIKVRSGPAHNT